jgi:phage major head subunit gpT-like protein
MSPLHPVPTTPSHFLNIHPTTTTTTTTTTNNNNNNSSIHITKHRKKFGMVISQKKSETMAFLGQDPVICKIVVGNKCLQKSKNFKYLGCENSYEN